MGYYFCDILQVCFLERYTNSRPQSGNDISVVPLLGKFLYLFQGESPVRARKVHEVEYGDWQSSAPKRAGVCACARHIRLITVRRLKWQRLDIMRE